MTKQTTLDPRATLAQLLDGIKKLNEVIEPSNNKKQILKMMADKLNLGVILTKEAHKETIDSPC